MLAREQRGHARPPPFNFIQAGSTLSPASCSSSSQSLNPKPYTLNLRAAVRVTHAHRRFQHKQIRDLGPRVGVHHQAPCSVDEQRSVLREHAPDARRPRPAIEPQHHLSKSVCASVSVACGASSCMRIFGSRPQVSSQHNALAHASMPLQWRACGALEYTGALAAEPSAEQNQ